MIDLDAMEAALAAMTSDPWEYDPVLDGMIDGPNGGAVCSIAQHVSMAALVATGEEYKSADARGIVVLRNNGAALVARVRELEADVALQGDALLRWREMTGCDTPYAAREEVASLRAVLGEALDGWDDAPALGDTESIERLRRILAGEPKGGV